MTIGIPPVRVGNEANFQLQEEYTRWEAVSPGPAEMIPMFHADFPGFTLKIVEHSRNLLDGNENLFNGSYFTRFWIKLPAFFMCEKGKRK
ncbi:MAG: hypothetical protein M3Z24_10100 [Chloroflexota bacterium]|nr:hypothetical protein [Chloroflexota bacterium]